ncbi:hypothetical protein PR048_014021 [Dryococelus australis]|uniref:Uncharacterized protein n=1 Tax=Dryococelus australis TaxID=614101 RepID=A0ABQ9HTU2_9NEOP|nr:hypothetical protein PR048_014021 [Dryococelus australis]
MRNTSEAVESLAIPGNLVDLFASKLDSTILCVFEPQLVVRWLILHFYLGHAAQNSVFVAPQVSYWLKFTPVILDRVTPDVHTWESCRSMTLVGGFSRGSLVCPTLSFRRRSTLTSITLIGSQDLDVSPLTHICSGTRRVHEHTNMPVLECKFSRAGRNERRIGGVEGEEGAVFLPTRCGARGRERSRWWDRKLTARSQDGWRRGVGEGCGQDGGVPTQQLGGVASRSDMGGVWASVVALFPQASRPEQRGRQAFQTTRRKVKSVERVLSKREWIVLEDGDNLCLSYRKSHNVGCTLREILDEETRIPTTRLLPRRVGLDSRRGCSRNFARGNRTWTMLQVSGFSRRSPILSSLHLHRPLKTLMLRAAQISSLNHTCRIEELPNSDWTVMQENVFLQRHATNKKREIVVMLAGY